MAQIEVILEGDAVNFREGQSEGETYPHAPTPPRFFNSYSHVTYSIHVAPRFKHTQLQKITLFITLMLFSVVGMAGRS